MQKQYLILHKVRGEPAFDIAQKMIMHLDSDPPGHIWWIIPTSGHGAYPYKWWDLEDLIDASDHPHDRPMDLINYDEVEGDPNWKLLRDHYEVNKTDLRATVKVAASVMLSKLGFKQDKGLPKRNLG